MKKLFFYSLVLLFTNCSQAQTEVRLDVQAIQDGCNSSKVFMDKRVELENYLFNVDYLTSNKVIKPLFFKNLADVKDFSSPYTLLLAYMSSVGQRWYDALYYPDNVPNIGPLFTVGRYDKEELRILHGIKFPYADERYMLFVCTYTNLDGFEKKENFLMLEKNERWYLLEKVPTEIAFLHTFFSEANGIKLRNFIQPFGMHNNSYSYENYDAIYKKYCPQFCQIGSKFNITRFHIAIQKIMANKSEFDFFKETE